MNIFIFDMDGVLLVPGGYHRALQETVRLAGVRSGFGETLLTDDQIAQFEALGVSSEWHSSALCLAWMVLRQRAKSAGQKYEHPQPGALNLDDLFAAIQAQPIQDSAIKRGMAALEGLAKTLGVSSEGVRELIEESESIQTSPTMNWFQELILGSAQYSLIYQKAAQFETESYLKLYDERLLSAPKADKVLQWAAAPGHGAAIMTSRPSKGPAGLAHEPDAQMGAELAGLQALPLVGNGEMLWLAEQSGKPSEDLKKPAWPHALSGILAAGGWPVERSLVFAARNSGDFARDTLIHLDQSTVTVFEDTMSGMVAVQEAVRLLRQAGLQVKLRRIGIAQDGVKKSALSALGAAVFPDINTALDELGL